MKDFNIAKYLKENHLGSHAILGRYVDLHALKEEIDYNNLTPEKLKDLADAGDFTAQRILKKMDDDATQKMKAQDSNPNDDGDCPQGMTPDPVFGCIREREEGLEGWKMVKKLATKDKSVAAAFLKPLVTVYGKDNVKIVKQGDFYKIYTKGKEELNNEADYGNNEPVDEVPYVGADKKLDGFGDEFDQVAPVEEIQMAGENPWLNNSIDGEMIGDWTAYFEDQVGSIYLVHPLLKDITVYATPGWEDTEGIAIAVAEEDIDRPWKNGIVPGSTNSYETFEEYAADMQSVLKDIENAYMEKLNPVEEIYSNSEQDKFDRMMDRAHEYFEKVSPIVRKTIESLRADGFGDQDIIDFLASDLS